MGLRCGKFLDKFIIKSAYAGVKKLLMLNYSISLTVTVSSPEKIGLRYFCRRDG
ncbi:hypothetical protein BH09BAC2_BH09BAC2_21460 [soil metagenome]